MCSLIAIASACARNDDAPIELTFDPCTLIVVPAPDLTAEEIASIDEAITLWHRAADTHASIGVNAADAPRLEIRFDDAAAAFRGLYDDQRGIVFINRALDDARVRAIVIAHELGHSFGLPHVEPSERVSLMNPENIDVAPTADDARAVHALWGRCSDR